jgi:hypothetical protein
MKQVYQHVVQGFIQHLCGKELEAAVAEEEEVISGLPRSGDTNAK